MYSFLARSGSGFYCYSYSVLVLVDKQAARHRTRQQQQNTQNKLSGNTSHRTNGTSLRHTAFDSIAGMASNRLSWEHNRDRVGSNASLPRRFACCVLILALSKPNEYSPRLLILTMKTTSGIPRGFLLVTSKAVSTSLSVDGLLFSDMFRALCATVASDTSARNQQHS